MDDFGVRATACIPRLRRYARALTGDTREADDLVQDTLERALVKRHLWREGSDLRAWMFTIMHNVFVNQVRSRASESRLREESAPDVETPDRALDLLNIGDMDAALHAMFDAVMDEPVPARMTALAANPRRAYHRMMPAAAVIAALALGAVSGWYLHAWQSGARGSQQASIVRQAAVAHVVYVPEVRHPVEVGADQEAHLAAWLSKRLGTAIRVPHLGEQGFALVGGRLLPGAPDERAPVAQFMYQDAKGLRLTLYVRTNVETARESAFRFAQEKNISVFYWVDQKLGYALSGEIEKSELSRVANAVYRQLNP